MIEQILYVGWEKVGVWLVRFIVKDVKAFG